jgi:hypothetical protein
LIGLGHTGLQHDARGLASALVDPASEVVASSSLSVSEMGPAISEVRMLPCREPHWGMRAGCASLGLTAPQSDREPLTPANGGCAIIGRREDRSPRQAKSTGHGRELTLRLFGSQIREEYKDTL